MDFLEASSLGFVWCCFFASAAMAVSLLKPTKPLLRRALLWLVKGLLWVGALWAASGGVSSGISYVVYWKEPVWAGLLVFLSCSVVVFLAYSLLMELVLRKVSDF